MKVAADYLDKGLIGLVALMDALRGDGGCPWDAKQTHESLAEFLIEESYELLDAINSKNYSELKEELGDLLLQIVFHARIAEESPNEGFDINQVANYLIAKLVSRHPHVFEEESDLAASDVKKNWEQLKAKEKNRTSAFEGVSRELPALLLASKILTRLEKYQPEFQVDIDPALNQLINQDTTQEELGALLLKLVKRSKEFDLEPEIALRSQVLKLDLREQA
jgi:XTP/dITP diphosphohydrolase